MTVAAPLVAPTPSVALTGLTKDYGAYRALDSIDVRIGGGVTGLLGPNGAGKSTLIKAMLGLVKVTAGGGTVLGHDLAREGREIRQRVGYMPEDDCYLAGLSGVRMVQFAAQLAGLRGAEALRRAHEILDFAGAREERYRPVHTYSTGMRQKVKFAQSIVHDPRFLILDEPTAGLDPEERRGLLRRIRTLGERAGMSILLATHLLHDVQEVCSSVIILARGRVLVQDRLEVLSRPAREGYTLGIHGDPGRLIDRIRAAGASVEPQADGLVRVSGVGADFRSRLFEWAAEAEVGIRRLEPARNSLEEIFLHAVGGDAKGESRADS